MSGFFNSAELRLAALRTRIAAASNRSAHATAWFRILFGFYLLVFVTPDFTWLGRVPASMFSPPILSVANLFDGFPPTWVLRSVSVVIPVLILMLTIGVRARLAGLALTGICVSLGAFEYSFGKIDHGILLWVTLACMSCSNWSTTLAVRPDKPVSQDRHETCLAILAICICFAFLTAGLEKAAGWVDFDTHTSGFLSWFYHGYFSLGRQHLLADAVFHVPPAFFEVVDIAAVTFELGAFVCLFVGPRAWRVWLSVACLFHLTNTLVLNIPFTTNVLVYGVFLLCARDTKTEHRRGALGLPWVLAAAALALWHIAARLLEINDQVARIPDALTSLPEPLFFALIFWPTVFAISVYHLVRRS